MSTEPDTGTSLGSVEAMHRTLARSLLIERFSGGHKVAHNPAVPDNAAAEVHLPTLQSPVRAAVPQRKYGGWTLASRRNR